MSTHGERSACASSRPHRECDGRSTLGILHVIQEPALVDLEAMGVWAGPALFVLACVWWPACSVVCSKVSIGRAERSREARDGQQNGQRETLNRALHLKEQARSRVGVRLRAFDPRAACAERARRHRAAVRTGGARRDRAHPDHDRAGAPLRRRASPTFAARAGGPQRARGRARERGRRLRA